MVIEASERGLSDEVISYVPALRAFARSLTRDREMADDLVQETLTKAIANLDKFTPGTNLRAWLFTIQRNTFYTWISKASREQTGGEDCVSQSGAPSLAVQPTQEWSARGREVMAVVDELPAHYREALVLVVMLGESYETTARVCDCAMGTVKSRVNRAREMVMDRLGERSL